MQTGYRLVFHGPNDNKDCRNAVARFARKYGGKPGYTSFWIGRRNTWWSPETAGKAAYSVTISHAAGRAALMEIRRLKKELISGLLYVLHY